MFLFSLTSGEIASVSCPTVHTETLSLGVCFVQLLINTAQEMGLSMPLRDSKGTLPFDRTMTDMFITRPNGSCFHSGARQQIVLYRLRTQLNFIPETRPLLDATESLNYVRERIKFGKHVRSHDLFLLIVSFGCYRPNLSKTMGHACSEEQVRDTQSNHNLP